jgi:hypothetical protein
MGIQNYSLVGMGTRMGMEVGNGDADRKYSPQIPRLVAINTLNKIREESK